MNIEKILAEAPEGATHFSECLNGMALVHHYLKLATDDCEDGWQFFWESKKDWVPCIVESIEEFNSIHSLDDLREIQKLRAENTQSNERIEFFMQEIQELSNELVSALDARDKLVAENKALKEEIVEAKVQAGRNGYMRCAEDFGLTRKGTYLNGWAAYQLADGYANELRQAAKG